MNQEQEEKLYDPNEGGNPTEWTAELIQHPTRALKREFMAMLESDLEPGSSVVADEESGHLVFDKKISLEKAKDVAREWLEKYANGTLKTDQRLGHYFIGAEESEFESFRTELEAFLNDSEEGIEDRIFAQVIRKFAGDQAKRDMMKDSMGDFLKKSPLIFRDQQGNSLKTKLEEGKHAGAGSADAAIVTVEVEDEKGKVKKETRLLVGSRTGIDSIGALKELGEDQFPIINVETDEKTQSRIITLGKNKKGEKPVFEKVQVFVGRPVNIFKDLQEEEDEIAGPLPGQPISGPYRPTPPSVPSNRNYSRPTGYVSSG